MINRQLRTKLELLQAHYSKYSNRDELKSRVIDDILNVADSDCTESYMTDVLEYGCSSGCVSSLIYYKDTYVLIQIAKPGLLGLLTKKPCANYC